MPTPVYVGGAIVGVIDNGVFIKHMHGRIHMLRKPPAWALDADTYENQIRPDCHTIKIEDIDSRIVYTVTVRRFEELKKMTNRGYGRQYFLVIKYWDQKRPTLQRAMSI